MRLWIDDIREPPDSWRSHHFVWAKTSAQAIDALAMFDAYGYKIDLISFDHDLGVDDTARTVVMFMVEQDIHAENYAVHSANPVGVEWLLGMIERYLL